MRNLSVKREFDAFLKEPQAVLLAYFSWSKRGLRALELFKEWEFEWREEHPKASVEFFCFDQSHYPNLAGLLFGLIRNNKGMTSGFGTVAWVKKFQRVGVTPSALRIGKKGLSRLTEKHFGPFDSAKI
jgi:hypothetical protein